MMKYPFPQCLRLSAALMGMTLFATTVYSQTTSPDRDVEDEDVVMLDPFSVSSERDYGYRATNSITATGSGESIFNTPLSISVITRDLIEDRGATEVIDVLRDVPGISASSIVEYDVYSRGFQSVMKMDGAEEIGNDFTTYNVERVEVVKGAVSILQGHASAGGVVNAISMRPKWEQQSTINAAYGSFDHKRAGFKTTGPLLGDKVAYLINYNRLNTHGWVDYVNREDDSIQFGLEIKPIERLTLNLDYQSLDRNSIAQQHLTFTHPDFLASELEAQTLYDANGLSRPSQYPRIGESTRGWMNRSGYSPDEPSDVVNVNELMYPNGYRANISGPQAFRDSSSEKGFVEAKYQFNPDWTLRSIYNVSDTERYNLAISTFRASGGLTIRERVVHQRTLRKRNETTNELVGSFDLLGMSHRLLAGFQYRTYDNVTNNLRTGFSVYNPRTDPVRNIAAEVQAANPNGFPEPNFAETVERAYYFSNQIEAWDERLHMMIGGRYGYRLQRGIEASRFTPQVGAVVAVPGVPGLAMYASYGESFRPNHNLDGNGDVIEPTIEVNTEGGLKMELLDGKISGTLSVYRLEQYNKSMRDHAREADLGISPLYIYAGRSESEGAEAEIIFTPVRNYQLKVSYSRIWEARTLEAEDPRLIGLRHKNAPEAQVSLWNKYTVRSGPFKGAYIGGGVEWFGENRLHASWSSPVYSENTWDVRLFAGHTFKVGDNSLRVTARVDNLTDEFFYQHTFRPNLPRRYTLEAKYTF